MPKCKPNNQPDSKSNTTSLGQKLDDSALVERVWSSTKLFYKPINSDYTMYHKLHLSH